MKLLIVALCLAIGPNLFISAGKDPRTHKSSDPFLSFGPGGRFVVAKEGDVLGKGDFGKVYLALDKKKNCLVAAKIETDILGKGTLLTEIKNYRKLGQRPDGFPTIYYDGESSGKSSVLVMQWLRKLKGLLKPRELPVLVMQLLETTLEDLRIMNRGTFSPPTVFKIGIQVLHCLRHMHSKGLVHGDIKPDNLSIDNRGELIYLYDLGESREFRDSNGNYLPSDIGHGTGSKVFRPIYSETHSRQFPDDDLEALGFTLIYFLRGNLPWNSKTPRKQRIKMKQSMEFCKGVPSQKQMIGYFQYVRTKRKNNSQPNYDYLERLLVDALGKVPVDQKFDWNRKEMISKRKQKNGE